MLGTFDPWRTLAAAGDVVRAGGASRAMLEARRAERLRSLLETAARRSPLYRRIVGTRDVARLRLTDLPVVRKAELMHQFDDWVTDPAIRLDVLRGFVADPANVGQAFLGRYVVWESSGSSGEPGLFVQDAAAMAVYDALEALRRPSPQPLLRVFDPWYLGERIAFVGATGGHFASTVSTARLRRLNPALAASLHEMSFLQALPQLEAALDALEPTIVATYPSAALLLAQECAAGRLQARPREVWTGGETLSPAVRRRIATVFGCAVVDSYGASEFFTLACECAHGRLHLNSDWAILEPVDADGRPVPAGEAGATVLLTNLANHVQPLIRYDLGDRVVVHAQPCACGSALPVIEVQGRHDDTLLLHAPAGRAVPLLPLALATVLEEDAALFDFQLRQTGPWSLDLVTAMDGVLARQALQRGRSALTAFLAGQGAAGVVIHVRAGQAYAGGRSGKVQRVLAHRHA